MVVPEPAPIALWVVPVPEIGGVARHVLDVARAGGIPGYRFMVLCPDGQLAEALRTLGAAVLTGPFGPDAGFAASLRTLRRTIKALRPGVVHSHLAYADIMAAAATRGLDVSLISTEHGIAPDDGLYHDSRAQAELMKRVHEARILAFDRLIAVCQSTKDVMETTWHPRRPVDVVLNGVDRPDTLPERTPGFRFASIARLSPEKNIDLLLKAFAQVLEQEPSATLVVAGSGPLEQDLKHLAGSLGLGDHVDFAGFVPADEVLSHSDVVVQLSAWENCSYTLLDACAYGLGVVATPVGGNPEILPARCLSSGNPGAIASLMLVQARDLRARPGLAAGWPTVREMCREIGQTYEEAR